MANDTTTTQTTQSTNGAPKPPARPAPLALPDTDGRAINAFASEAHFISAQRMATALGSSTLVPQAYQGNIPNVLIAMELANRIGASVFAVMQNLDIIHGRPSWRATFLIACVNGSNRFTPMRFRWEGKTGTDDWGCRAWAKDKENGEECLGALITIGLAKAEGWSSKNGSKWKTMPEQMLMYRAASFWSRIYAPEMSLGMQTAEEAIDLIPDETGTFSARPVIATGDVKALEAELLGAAARIPPKPDSKPDSKPARDIAAEADAIKEAIANAKTDVEKANVLARAKDFASDPNVGEHGVEALRFFSICHEGGA